LTVFAGFILAVLLHAAPVLWVEIQQNKPPSEVSAPILIDSMEKATFERGSATTDDGPARTAVD
jgi:hypothetical protein